MLKKLLVFLYASLFVASLESGIPGTPSHFFSIHDDEQQEAIVCKDVHLIRRHMLPKDHAIKETLDKIFSSSRVLASLDTMRAAGFKKPSIRKKQMIIGRHPEIQGFLLKVYLDSSDIYALENFTTRIKGATMIQKLIDKLGYQDVCMVPKKWLYKIPSVKHTKENKSGHNKYILVVEELKINKVGINSLLYKSDSITTRHLDALFTIVTKLGLNDSLRIGNVPYTNEGYIAFIDTEFHGNQQAAWREALKFSELLSPENAIYWKNLCKTHRPKSEDL